MRWLKRDDDGSVAAGPEPAGAEPAGADPEPTVRPAESDGLIDSADVPQLTDAPAAPAAAVTPDVVPAVGQTADADTRAGADAGAVTTAADTERRQLIELLMYAWDRARSPGVWERLTEGLAAVGVTVLRPDGEPFDPNAHEVGGVEPTADDALVDTVAETEVAGFADRGMVIREPVVVVYRRQIG